jgi:hypothetical protein
MESADSDRGDLAVTDIRLTRISDSVKLADREARRDEADLN